MARRLDAAIERWPLAAAFTISRGSKTEAVPVVVRLTDGEVVGRGECLPYPRYGQSPDAVLAEVLRQSPDVSRGELLGVLPAGAARNALDCALWDLEAKQQGRRVWELLALGSPAPLVTCYTLSLAPPEAMAQAARDAARLPLLKLKLGGSDAAADIARMKAVRAARPDARLVADANEGWAVADLDRLLGAAADVGMEVVEQPLPEHADAALANIVHHVPVAADESAHTAAGLADLATRYDAVNIKLDKTGGLTAALAMAAEARRLGLDIMVGSMVSTSLSMAPAFVLAQGARWADLDSPLLLARDRAEGMTVADGMIFPPSPALWG